MRLLVTGGCGFIGSNLVRYLRRTRPDWTIVNLDKLTYAGNLENLAELEEDPRHLFIRGDITDRPLVEQLIEKHSIQGVMHLAAESHVDRSILGPEAFTQTNVVGTQVLLEAARRAGALRFLMVSTDEVYGSLGSTGTFSESSPLCPSSPYSASKAGADLLALSYHRTFGLDVVVTRCSNNYGRYQFPEKLIPLMIVNALRNQQLPVYGDGENVRDWLNVDDHCQAMVLAMEKGRAGAVYNIGGESERRNIDIVREILKLLGRSEKLIRFVADRPGHDRRYAMNAGMIRDELGWVAAHTFERGLEETVQWYVENASWWERVMSGAYLEYYDAQYRARLQARQS